MVYSTTDKNTGGFCLLTVYPSTASTGSPNSDFANEWNEKVVKPFKAQANPKTATQTEDGWTSVSAATQFESDGTTSAVMMTVISGYGRTASVLAILNNQEYLPQIDAFMTGIKMEYNALWYAGSRMLSRRALLLGCRARPCQTRGSVSAPPNGPLRCLTSSEH